MSMRLKEFTCCTSAAVLRNSSIYRFPRICLCFFRAFWAYSSQEKSTKASPVGRPSGYLTKSRPSAPSVTGLSGPRKDSTSWDVAVNGSPRMRIITWFSLDRNWATSLDVPGVGQQQQFNTWHHKAIPLTPVGCFSSKVRLLVSGPKNQLRNGSKTKTDNQDSTAKLLTKIPATLTC